MCKVKWLTAWKMSALRGGPFSFLGVILEKNISQAVPCAYDFCRKSNSRTFGETKRGRMLYGAKISYIRTSQENIPSAWKGLTEQIRACTKSNPTSFPSLFPFFKGRSPGYEVE